MAVKAFTHNPNYAVPPGETLLEELEAREMTQAELAERTGRPLKTINEIVKGKSAITPETALQFERVLGITATFWNNLERQYREKIAAIEEHTRLQGSKEWAKKFPVDELVERKLITRSADAASMSAQLLNFFGVSSPHTCDQLLARQQAAYRRSPVFEKAGSPEALACWLRQGELRAQSIKCPAFDRSKLRARIPALRALTLESEKKIKSKIIELCLDCGVIVELVKDFPKTYVSGATRWLSAEKALIQLSCRNKRNDSFWFTFFHEIGHILLHGKKEVFIDVEKTDRNGSQEEHEANEFAVNVLIPAAKWRAFLNSGFRTEQDICSFAEELEIDPAVVVGQLQFAEIIPYSQFNYLRRAFDISE
jgi:HTH-type transcriptional regulator / antitoxin HigA